MSLNKFNKIAVSFDFASLYPKTFKTVLNMNPTFRKTKIRNIFNERFKQEN